jgi:prophage maintenance system killer protein/transcriptional regulator CtsR
MKKNVIREEKGLWDRGHGEIVLYRERSGAPGLEVRLAGETLWLNQAQLAQLFDRNQSVIARHIKNVFKEGELAPSESNMQKMHNAISDKPILFYNLDVIVSVGYRVNSKRGTQFRIWATNVLKEHIVKGYTENARRLQELRQSLQIIEHVLDRNDVSSDEARALLRVVTDYSYALDLLDDYDHQRVPAAPVHKGEVKAISYEEARRLIERLREKFGAPAIFGQEKDESLHSSLNAILQTFGGKDVYPGLEEKAAHLLYFLVKNHSFIDGNKRIAVALFLWFMEKNRLLYGLSGEKRISDVTLVALTLMVAESAPREKDPIIRIVMNLISKRT